MSKTVKKTKKTATNPVVAKPENVVKAVRTAKASAASACATGAQPSSAPKSGHVSIALEKPEARSVAVAGSFNDWKPETAPLKLAGKGRWVGELAIAPGKHEYLFVVDGQWIPDPNARESVENPYGGRNSVLTVSA
jgi:1,4-alpha-glucan branching enzyme